MEKFLGQISRRRRAWLLVCGLTIAAAGLFGWRAFVVFAPPERAAHYAGHHAGRSSRMLRLRSRR